jgi:predicted kinase
MSKQFFLQMSGMPGSGKTTLATAIGKKTGAVVIDHDVTKTALLNAGISIKNAGKASYELLGAMAEHLLTQGHSVIFDSPCFYISLLERGQAQAKAVGADYFFIECMVGELGKLDFAEIDRRLRARPEKRSQIRGINLPPIDVEDYSRTGKTAFNIESANMKRPRSGYLVLDTQQPMDVCLDRALAYLKRN